MDLISTTWQWVDVGSIIRHSRSCRPVVQLNKEIGAYQAPNILDDLLDLQSIWVRSRLRLLCVQRLLASMIYGFTST